MNTRQQPMLEKTPDEFLGAEGHTACRNTIGAACWSLRVFASKTPLAATRSLQKLDDEQTGLERVLGVPRRPNQVEQEVPLLLFPEFVGPAAVVLTQCRDGMQIPVPETRRKSLCSRSCGRNRHCQCSLVGVPQREDRIENTRHNRQNQGSGTLISLTQHHCKVVQSKQNMPKNHRGFLGPRAKTKLIIGPEMRFLNNSIKASRGIRSHHN